MKRSHIFDPRHIAVLEAEDRKVWQNVEEILGAVEIKPDFVAADLGCGSGYFTVPLSQRVRKVYAIDVQEEMLSFLEDKIKKLQIRNIKPLLSKSNRIPLENESIDLLISINALHEFNNRKKTIKEIKRVMKKEGRALIVDFRKEETGFGPPVSIRVSKKQAVKLFMEEGLTLSKTKPLPNHYLLVFSKK